jgi:glycosyltransferase involved in cell wall biosynthesis
MVNNSEQPDIRQDAVSCIHWFSPLPPARTGIADYTTGILPYLQQRCQIVLWTDQQSWDERIEQCCEVRSFHPATLKADALEPRGIPIFHIGNNPMHQGIWEVSRRIQGVSVLHDTRLQHLFAHVLRDRYGDKQQYISAMSRCYGIRGARAADRFWSGGHTTEEMATKFPLASLAAEQSSICIVHSKESLELLEKEVTTPTLYLPLPYAARSEPSARKVGPPFRIVLCGYFGANRRLEAFLTALGTFEEKHRFQVEIYGTVWDPEHIKKLISDHALSDIVVVNGYLEDLLDLDRALAGAHLGVNLRYPTMGEASMSQLQLWEHGIPSLVTPVGWYASLPEDTVLFVRPEAEVEDIQNHLRAFLRDPKKFACIGARAREVLLTVHNPARYADALMDILTRFAEFSLHSLSVKLGSRVGREIGSWLPPQALSDLLPKLSVEICFLFATAAPNFSNGSSLVTVEYGNSC